MKNQRFLVLKNLRIVWIFIGSILFGSFDLSTSPLLAQVLGDSSIPQEKEFYNTLPGNNQEGTILDATNPMDLMNRLRRATAMDDATTPSDAIDEALKAFETDDQIIQPFEVE